MKALLRYNEPNLQIVQEALEPLGEAIMAKTKSTLHCSLLGGEFFVSSFSWVLCERWSSTGKTGS